MTLQVLVHQSLIYPSWALLQIKLHHQGRMPDIVFPVRKERQTADIPGFAQQCNVTALGSFTTKTDDDYLH